MRYKRKWQRWVIGRDRAIRLLKHHGDVTSQQWLGLYHKVLAGEKIRLLTDAYISRTVYNEVLERYCIESNRESDIRATFKLSDDLELAYAKQFGKRKVVERFVF